jgi:hypothetical protein
MKRRAQRGACAATPPLSEGSAGFVTVTQWGRPRASLAATRPFFIRTWSTGSSRALVIVWPVALPVAGAAPVNPSRRSPTTAHLGGADMPSPSIRAWFLAGATACVLALVGFFALTRSGSEPGGRVVGPVGIQPAAHVEATDVPDLGRAHDLPELGREPPVRVVVRPPPVARPRKPVPPAEPPPTVDPTPPVPASVPVPAPPPPPPPTPPAPSPPVAEPSPAPPATPAPDPPPSFFDDSG